jgi:hypothetical protein
MKQKAKELLDALTDWLERLLPEPTLEPVPVPVEIPQSRR